jgi:hypothetical protein
MADQLYKVREGKRFGAFDQYESGDTVVLDELAAVPFLDKLEPVTPATAAGEAQANPAPVNSDTLPSGFPHATKLAASGYTTVTAVREATDAQLIALKGIGKAAVVEIREALA